MKAKPKKKNILNRQQVKIISDGTSFGTKVLSPNGELIPDIEEVIIDPINIDSNLVRVKLIISNVELEIKAKNTEKCKREKK